MLNAAKEMKEQVLHVRLEGTIEETVVFDQLIGPPPRELAIFCRGVSRINSIGVKSWIKYFQGLSESGVTFSFYECSTAIVEQINLISNFTAGGKVESIYVPFACNSCKTELVGCFKCEDLKKIQFKIPELKCSKCSGQAVFDDIPEEYFGFLNR
jgi:anti-anti-sigma regulatory factor